MPAGGKRRGADNPPRDYGAQRPKGAERTPREPRRAGCGHRLLLGATLLQRESEPQGCLRVAAGLFVGAAGELGSDDRLEHALGVGVARGHAVQSFDALRK